MGQRKQPGQQSSDFMKSIFKYLCSGDSTYVDSPGGSAGKESACSVGDLGSICQVCNFFSSDLPQQKFGVMDGPVLQLSFIWQAKENTSSRREGGPTQKTQREESSSI